MPPSLDVADALAGEPAAIARLIDPADAPAAWLPIVDHVVANPEPTPALFAQCRQLCPMSMR